ncbi:SdpI family protein [Pontibacillus litoralis]|uniref:DUF1648 domain-containing protein n=1 Tax=Pontibacillus litoralis JSM 072002 TaxID=1385512 RepID=A0A0A5FYA0_9BACI|nr:SdpI family protein [Pontibacillus litoralis]KGX85796.1 hypothetical protein N784_08215 [Pontibacillus litoralis JSM 072002]
MKSNTFIIIPIIISVLIGLIALPNLPNDLAIHWSTTNNADAYIDKRIGVFIIPLIMIMTIVTLKLAFKNQKMKHINLILLSCTILFLIIQVLLILNGLHILNSNSFLGLFVGALIVVLGNFMQDVKMNNLYGLRTKWSMKNEDIWRLSNRFAAKAFVITGLLIILSTIAFPNYIHYIAIGLVVIAAAISSYASYHYYKTFKYRV